MTRLLSAFTLVLISNLLFASPPDNFSQAKVIAKNKVYFDQNSSDLGELYCGCSWVWAGKSGGRINFASCGYDIRKQANRAARVEWEHIVPAQTFGNQRQCWQNGGRKNCVSDDPVFRAMEADLFNLYPSVGEVNGDRSNFNYGMVSGVSSKYGQCTTKVDFPGRATEPRNEVKGMVSRTTFYMFDRYGLNMSRQQQQLLMSWDKQYPVTAWEKLRDARIASIMGHHNEFVTGTRKWTPGYKPVMDGVVSQVPKHIGQPRRQSSTVPTVSMAVIGNRNSQIYHLAEGCPSHLMVSAKNQVMFENESEAKAAGYRKAKNCK